MSIRYSKQIFKTVNEAFEQKRAAALRRQTENRAAAAKKDARFTGIERELALTVSELISAVAEGNGAEEKTRAAREKNLSLQSERRALLKKYGLPDDFLDIKYECKKCGDEGFAGAEMCSCYADALKAEAHKTFNLSIHMPDATFETFDTSLYTGDAPEDDMTPRENAELALKACRRFVRDFSKSDENILLTGKNGLGKTHLSSAIAHALIDEGFDVVYETAGAIFTLMEDVRFGRISEEAQYRTDRLSQCDLLIIDDLGSEFTTQFVRAALFSVVNSRLMSDKKMIISTNLTPEAIGELYDERVYSRIAGRFTTIELYGDDIRQILKERRR
ncbi:MAG: ATP-binding protein [Clostridia bacterium]|nr:ATP-binding protein [Clostridia bacterium]